MGFIVDKWGIATISSVFVGLLGIKTRIPTLCSWLIMAAYP